MDIKTLRAATGLTQKAFAELTDIPKRTIEQWESERRNPPAYLLKLIKYFLENENYIKMEDIKMSIDYNNDYNAGVRLYNELDMDEKKIAERMRSHHDWDETEIMALMIAADMVEEYQSTEDGESLVEAAAEKLGVEIY